MSDQQLTHQETQPKAKHAGGRPRKPKPAPPPPPPAPYSLEETLQMGDQAAARGTPAAQLRWVSQRVPLVQELEARKDADRHDALETDNRRLQERIEASERAKRDLQNELGQKDRDLAAATAENKDMAEKLKEEADEHAKQLVECTNTMRATERKAKGLLAIVQCFCLQMKDHSQGQRIEYAARLMRFSEQASKRAQRLAGLVNYPEVHRAHYLSRNLDLRHDPGGHGVFPEQFSALMKIREQQIEESMRADRESLAFELSNVIPDEVMNRAFELLSVTREEVVRQLDAKQQEGKK